MIDLNSAVASEAASVAVAAFDPIQVGILIATVIAIAWGAREWYYGGSVLKVSFELGQTNGKALARAMPVDFIDPQTVNRRFAWRLEGPLIDVAVITVSNRGRTPATIVNPGLVFTSRAAEPLRAAGVLVEGFGSEQEHRVRIEAHDSRVFVFMLQSMVDVAVKDIHFQTPQGTNGDLWARAIVTSGTGKDRRSSRMVWSKGRWNGRRLVSGLWKVRTPLVKEPTVMERLLVEYFLPRVKIYDQLLAVASAIQAAESAVDMPDVFPMLREMYGPVNGMGLLMQARMLNSEARSRTETDPERTPDPEI